MVSARRRAVEETITVIVAILGWPPAWEMSLVT